MSGPTNVIVLEPDERAGRQVQLGFEREGVPTAIPAIPPDLGKLSIDVTGAGLVVVGGTDGQAVALVERMRALLAEQNLDVPVISTGRGVTRAALEAAGADEVFSQPLYLRDVVTVSRILRGIPATKRNHIVGSLVETTGVYTLVRALASLGRSAVLTLIRGLRRGEVRFYRGEVTSAEVGLIHGQAAFHQLLLWTDARFDFAHEDIVRRQQIPLTPDELFADAERFLEGVRECAGSLSPATVLEQNVQRIQELGKQIPTEVHGVLRMFDGHRVLTDVLEDSPYRVFETLRVAQKAVEAGLLRTVDSQRPKATWRAVLAIDEWLVGNETRDAVVERTATIGESEPVPAGKRGKGKGKSKARSKRPRTPPVGVKTDIDWGALVPRVIGAEVGPLSGVVPAFAAAGEVDVASRDRAREKLEAMMDTDKRDRIFPREVGIEPTIVVEGDTGEVHKADTDLIKKVSAGEVASDEPETVGSAKRKKKRAERLKAEAEKAEAKAKARAEAEARARDAAAAEKAAADARVAAQAKADEEARAAAAKAKADEAAAQAKAKSDAEAAAQARAKAEQDARIAAEARAKADADAAAHARAKADAEAAAQAKAKSDAEAATQAAARPAPKADEPKPAADQGVSEATAQRSDAVIQAAHAIPRDRPGGADAKDLVRRLVAEATSSDGAPAPSADASSAAVTAPVRATDDLATKPFVRPDVDDVLRSQIAQPMTSTDAAATSTPGSTAPPRIEVPKIIPPAPVAKPGASAAPVATDDDPSDGIVRSTFTGPDSDQRRARARLLQPPTSTPEHDGPAIKETTGEIGSRAPRSGPTAEPSTSEPSILVSDLAAAHNAIAAVVHKPAPPPPPADAASPSRELEVSDVRRDAVAFSEDEEEFFKGAESHTNAVPKVDVESFEDLDHDYEPTSFWGRVFGKKKK